MEHAQKRLRVSQRRACRVLGQARSTQRRQPWVAEDEPPLVRRIIQLAAKYGRYGYRRITALLRGEGWRVNHKRVQRIWRQEGLKVSQKQPKRGRLWRNDGSCIRLRPERKDHVWAYDFVADRTREGRPIRMLVIVDEYTRECLAIDVERNMNSERVLERLWELFLTRGVPAYIRSACYVSIVKERTRETRWGVQSSSQCGLSRERVPNVPHPDIARRSGGCQADHVGLTPRDAHDNGRHRLLSGFPEPSSKIMLPS